MDDWAAALSLLKVSAERDVSPSRVDSDVRALPSGGPTQQGYGAFPQAPPGLAPPPPPLPPSMEEVISLDDLESLSMGQQARAPPASACLPPPPVVSAAPGAGPGVARRPRGLVHGPASKGPASARQPPAAASPPEDLSVYTECRSMPMLFGMLSGAAPRPTTHAQPKAGSQTAHPKAITKAPNGYRHTSDNRALLNQKRRMRKSRTSEQWLKTEGGPMESTRVESRGRGATPTDLPTNKSKEISSLGSPAFNQLSQRAVDDDMHASGSRALRNYKRRMRKKRTSEQWLKTEGGPMERA